MGSATIQLLVLSDIRKQTEQAMRNQHQKDALLHGFCINSCFLVPTLSPYPDFPSRWSSPFLLKLLCIVMLYHCITKP